MTSALRFIARLLDQTWRTWRDYTQLKQYWTDQCGSVHRSAFRLDVTDVTWREIKQYWNNHCGLVHRSAFGSDVTDVMWRDVTTHNQIWRPLCSYVTGRFRSKTVLKRPVWFGLSLSFWIGRDKRDVTWLTHTIKSEDLTPFLHHWLFQDQIWRPHSVTTSL